MPKDITLQPNQVQITGYTYNQEYKQVANVLFKHTHVREDQKSLDLLKKLFSLKHNNAKVVLILRYKQGNKFKA